MKLLTDEEVLLTSNNDKIILTNQRISMTEKSSGQAFSIGIFLEDISSIETKYRSFIIFIVFGVISVLGGLYASSNSYHSNGGEILLGFILGAMFLALWFFSRRHIVSIGSKGRSSLNFMVQGMSKDEINDFVYKVSQAKLNRVNQLHK